MEKNMCKWFIPLAYMANVFFSLGSNVGDRSNNLELAMLSLIEQVGALLGKSSLYESEPWGYTDQNQYINQVIWLNTTLMPHEVLSIAMDIEKKLGRVRSGKEGYEARSMDIDILFFDKIEIHADTLTIPHPRMHLRNFVLVPLAEIAPNMIHPVLRESVVTLRDNCNDKAKINMIEVV